MNRKKHLTIQAIKSLPLPPAGSKQPNKLYDKTIPAFAAFKYSTRRVTWNLAFRVNGDLKTKMLGTYPTLSIGDARKKAHQILNAAFDGKDLAAVQRDQAKKPSFGKVAEEYLEKHAKPNKRRPEEDERLIKKELLPAWKRKRAHEIKRRDVVELLNGIVKRGAPIQANRVMSLISKIFNWGIGQDIVDYNPCTQVKKPAKENRRERVLSDEEVRQIWRAFEKQNDRIGSLLKLRLLTAQRGGEIESMAWKDLDLKSGWWTIPGEIAKNGQSHRVPLTPYALLLLKQLQPTGDDVWVFPSPTVEGQHIFSVQKAAIRVKKLSGVGDFVLHDLRRTAASYMASLGVGTHVISKILNHVEPGVTAVYNRYSYDAEKRAALEVWESKLLEIVNTKQENLTAEQFPSAPA